MLEPPVLSAAALQNAHACRRGADRLDVVLIILGLIGSAANGERACRLQLPCSPTETISVCVPRNHHSLVTLALCRCRTASICRRVRQLSQQVRHVSGMLYIQMAKVAPAVCTSACIMVPCMARVRHLDSIRVTGLHDGAG